MGLLFSCSATQGHLPLLRRDHRLDTYALLQDCGTPALVARGLGMACGGCARGALPR